MTAAEGLKGSAPKGPALRSSKEGVTLRRLLQPIGFVQR